MNMYTNDHQDPINRLTAEWTTWPNQGSKNKAGMVFLQAYFEDIMQCRLGNYTSGKNCILANPTNVVFYIKIHIKCT